MMSSKKESNQNQSFYMAEPKNEEYINRIVNGILDVRLKEKSYYDLLSSGGEAVADYVITREGSNFICTDGATRKEIKKGTIASTVLQYALAQANTIDGTVVVKKGDYPITTVLDFDQYSNIKFISLGANLTRDSSNRMMELDRCDNIEISGFKFTVADAETDYLIYLIGCTDIRIHDNGFSGGYSAIVASSYAAAHTWCERVWIERNEFTDVAYSSVLMGNGCKYFNINNNFIHDCNKEHASLMYGIASGTVGASDATASDIQFINICNNTIKNFDAHSAIDLHGGNNIVITGNQIYDVPDYGIFVHYIKDGGMAAGIESNWVIADNIVEDCKYPIYVSCDTSGCEVRNVAITGNCIQGYEYYAIMVMAAAATTDIHDVAITGNTIDNHGGTYAWGSAIKVTAHGSADTTCGRMNISGNIINTEGTVNSDFAIWADEIDYINIIGNVCSGACGTGYIRIDDADDCVVSNNLIQGNGLAIYSVNADYTMITGNRIQATTPISFNNAACVSPMIMGNNWEGSTNDHSTGSATNPRITNNIDRTGAWDAGDNPG